MDGVVRRFRPNRDTRLVVHRDTSLALKNAKELSIEVGSGRPHWAAMAGGRQWSSPPENNRENLGIQMAGIDQSRRRRGLETPFGAAFANPFFVQVKAICLDADV